MTEAILQSLLQTTRIPGKTIWTYGAHLQPATLSGHGIPMVHGVMIHGITARTTHGVTTAGTARTTHLGITAAGITGTTTIHGGTAGTIHGITGLTTAGTTVLIGMITIITTIITDITDRRITMDITTTDTMVQDILPER